MTDKYWKESYRCIRTWYPHTPILIIDDSSNQEFLKEDIVTSKCTVIYDTTHKGSAEFLPYYYFHLLHPFDTAVIIHDSIFVQRYIDFTLDDNESVRFLWAFYNIYDHTINDAIEHIFGAIPSGNTLLQKYYQITNLYGCFGVMSVIKWDFLHHINNIEHIFENWLPIITTRHYRCALERCFAILLIHYSSNMKPSFYGDIYKYIEWGTTFEEYQLHDWHNHPLIKVWTSR
jgi:hypothetical protein